MKGWSKFAQAFGALAVASGLAIAVSIASREKFFEDVAAWGYDQLAIHSTTEGVDRNLVVVDFDDRTQQKIGRYPIPRDVVAQVLRAVHQGEPRIIGLDLLLTEPRPAEDAVLAKEISAAGNVVLASELVGAGGEDLLPLPQFCTPDRDDPAYCSEGAMAVGFTDIPVDDDGLVRRGFLLPPAAKNILPFATMLATNAVGKPVEPGAPGTANLRDHVIRLDGRGLNTFLIGDWTEGLTQPVSALDVLEGRAPDDRFHGKIVIIGQSSEAGRDRHFTPLFRTRDAAGLRRMVPGPAIQAAAVSAMLRGSSIAPVNRTTIFVALAGVGCLALIFVLAFRPAISATAVAALGAGAFLTAQALFNHKHLWFDFTAAIATLTLALPVGYGWRYVREHWLRGRIEAERASLMALFSRYVSAEAAEEIWRRRDEIRLEGEERTATVLFSDIRDFTRTTEGKPSGEVIAWLNEYFEAMSATIHAQSGFLNKFIGDGIMAVYGVPLSNGESEDARNALRTALAMLEAVEKLNRAHAGLPERPQIRIGIGIHSGELTAGTVGASDRMEYSVIGETVNLASRLESLTKEFGVPIVLSASAKPLVESEFELRPLGSAKVKGIAGDVEVYTVAMQQSANANAGGER